MSDSAIDPAEIGVAAFLQWWYGSPNPAPGEMDPLFDWVPDGLKRCHEMSARWNLPSGGVKRLLPLSDLSEEERKFIFMADQGGWAWAFDPTEPLAVFEAKDDDPWRRLLGGWEDFFLYHVFTETVENAPFVQWSTNISTDDVEQALAPFQEISFRQSRWPAEGWRSYVADGMIADVGPREGGGDRFSITVGAKVGERLEYLNAVSGVEWRVRRNGLDSWRQPMGAPAWDWKPPAPRRGLITDACADS
ncbi:hypothetical protein ACFY4C_16330 [Actinomadura viridis]|uniref:hypothetical protein n=1 Tax=Actinomadura viridis TaxID=58110 RepID=UPI0036940857